VRNNGNGINESDSSCEIHALSYDYAFIKGQVIIMYYHVLIPVYSRGNTCIKGQVILHVTCVSHACSMRRLLLKSPNVLCTVHSDVYPR